MKSLRDEIEYLLSGMGMPYHKVAMTIAIAVTILFTIAFPLNYAKNAPVAVIDLDNSRLSQTFTEQLGTSPYLDIKTVLHTPTDPETLMYHDEHLAVIYIPRDFEKNRYSLTPNNIGVFYDNLNIAQTGHLKEGLNEVIGAINAKSGAEHLGALGLSKDQTAAVLQSISLKERLLFNPVDAHSNSSTFAFLIFFGSMFLVFATIGMVPRLKLMHRWKSETERGFGSLLLRLVPYVVCFTVSILLGFGLTALLGDLSFAGSYPQILAAIILTAVSTAAMSVLIGWGAPNPGVAISRMILFIPAGFILGGASGPLNLVPPAVQFVSNLFPLVWSYRLFRDVAQRGAPLTDCIGEYSAYLCYIAVLTLLLYLRFRRAQQDLQQTKEESA
ncbi:MAG: ABC transporter permease [Selenomonadales bacterium]|nr:ABC transporter permease [Selenomonadales bacterium]